MDTRLLRSFLTVAHLGSFTAAAVELGRTQSTVTSHLQKLEHQLGDSLLDRLPTGVVLTELGARILPHAEDILAAEDRLQGLPAAESRPSGTVRLMAPESVCTYRLPQIISAVRQAEPQVQIWVSPGGLHESLEALRQGRVDLALTLEPLAPATDLQLEDIGTEELVLIDSPSTSGHSDQAIRSSWAELAGRDALLIAEGCGYSDHVASRLAATGQEPGRRSQFGSVEAIKRCVDVGLGWTVLPRMCVAEEIRSGALRVIDGPSLPKCGVHMLTHPRRHRGSAMVAVAEQLRHSWHTDSQPG